VGAVHLTAPKYIYFTNSILVGVKIQYCSVKDNDGPPFALDGLANPSVVAWICQSKPSVLK